MDASRYNLIADPPGAKPFPGVMPHYLWKESHPAPSLKQLLDRYCLVSQAVDRYSKANLHIPPVWLQELGTLK